MSASFARIAAIVRADFLVRFRRISTVIVFLLLSAFAYVWIPDPSTGRTLIQINGQRAINFNVFKQQDANIVVVGEAVKKALDELRKGREILRGTSG